MDESGNSDSEGIDSVSANLNSLQIDRSASLSNRPRNLRFAALFFGVLLLSAGLTFLLKKSPREDSPPARIETAPLETEEAAPALETTNWTLAGHLVARRESLVSAEITAKVSDLFVEEGKRVEKGQIVARLDSELAEADLRVAELRVEAAAHEIRATEAELIEAQKFLERTKKISGTGATSESDLNKAESRFATLSARFAQAKTVREAAIRVAQRAEVILSKHTITAPFPGIVTDCPVEVGETISIMSSSGTSTGGICTIIDPTSIEIELDLPEKLIGRITPGMPAAVVLDAHPGIIFEAKVKSIAPTANREKATIQTWLEFLDSDSRFRPEMAAKVNLQPDIQ